MIQDQILLAHIFNALSEVVIKGGAYKEDGWERDTV